MNIVIDTSRMPHTTELWNLARGAEHLYYMLLFTGGAYRADARVWRSWRVMGLGLGIRSAPPGARPPDRVRSRVRSSGKRVEIEISGGDPDVVTSLVDLLAEIDRIRGRLRNLDAEERASRVLELPAVRRVLVEPLHASLDAADLDEDSRRVFLAGLARDLAAFTYPDIDAERVAV